MNDAADAISLVVTLLAFLAVTTCLLWMFGTSRSYDDAEVFDNDATMSDDATVYCDIAAASAANASVAAAVIVVNVSTQ